VRVPRVFTELPLQTGIRIRLDTEAGQHVGRVLRLRTGSEIELFNGGPVAFRATLLRNESEAGWDAEVIRELTPESEAGLELHLAQCISRGERMDLVIQKAVELGATRITPLFSRRSVVQLSGKRLERRHDHWRRIIVHACGQSGRNRLPLLDPSDRLDSWLALEPAATTRVLLDLDARTNLDQLTEPTGGLLVLIGPEGGLDEKERESARAHAFLPVRLGHRILRTETAALATLAAAQTLWGDFRSRALKPLQG
jgi:16S rRNA (uracil1498-N3)-methyltransferase